MARCILSDYLTWPLGLITRTLRGHQGGHQEWFRAPPDNDLNEVHRCGFLGIEHGEFNPSVCARLISIKKMLGVAFSSNPSKVDVVGVVQQVVSDILLHGGCLLLLPLPSSSPLFLSSLPFLVLYSEREWRGPGREGWCCYEKGWHVGSSSFRVWHSPFGAWIWFIGLSDDYD